MRALIFANGELPYPNETRRLCRADDLIICADGGARHALALKLRPHLVVGDLDSIDPDTRARLERIGSRFETHPTDKDATDLELALLAARRLGVDEALLLGGLGGRLDQTLGNLLLLASNTFSDLRLSLSDGIQTAWIVRERLTVYGRPGDILSVLALSPIVKGLTYHGGLRWLLHDFTLPFGSSRGISNQMTAGQTTITLESGILLVLHMPGTYPA
ncbi:MAG: thiamine diphosphokinase [Caldilineae bacterium]|nr:MAG: thiamine diphosphokinase [Caldilineae bacterium]